MTTARNLPTYPFSLSVYFGIRRHASPFTPRHSWDGIAAIDDRFHADKARALNFLGPKYVICSGLRESATETLATLPGQHAAALQNFSNAISNIGRAA